MPNFMKIQNGDIVIFSPLMKVGRSSEINYYVKINQELYRKAMLSKLQHLSDKNELKQININIS